MGHTTEQNSPVAGVNVFENVGHGPGGGGKWVPSAATFPMECTGARFWLGGGAGRVVMPPLDNVRPGNPGLGPVAVYITVFVRKLGHEHEKNALRGRSRMYAAR